MNGLQGGIALTRRPRSGSRIVTAPEDGAFPGKTFRRLGGGSHPVRIVRWPFAEAEVMKIRAPPVEVSQGGPAKEANRFHLVLQVSGRGHCSGPESRFEYGAGDVLLLDGEAPCRVVQPVSAYIVRWSLPEAALEPFICASPGIAAQRFEAGEGLTAVLAETMRVLANRNLELDAEARSAMLAHLCGLAGMALEFAKRPGLRRRRHIRTLQRQRLLDHIQTHLRDPRLSAASAAAALGVSTRWVHALLHESPTGFADLVAGRRLERCMAVLQDPAHDRVPIAEIAFAAGFNDLSTFYRRFKARYRTSPRAVRSTRGDG